MTLQPGTRLGSYEITSLLGSGGMGQVYRAKDHKLGRDVAIKVLREELASDPERLRRFEQEAEDDWRWFEPELTYENALLPLALFRFSIRTGDQHALRVARDSLSFLESTCFANGHLQLIGNAGWHARGAEPMVADEQPIDASAFVLAFRAAHDATGDRQQQLLPPGQADQKGYRVFSPTDCESLEELHQPAEEDRTEGQNKHWTNNDQPDRAPIAQYLPHHTSSEGQDTP